MMNPISLLNWMLLSTALLGAWWACYRLALRQERSFAYNRAFLVLGPLLATCLPLLPLAWPAGWWGTGPAGLPGVASVLLPAAKVAAGTMPGSPAFDWAFWLKVGYLGGAALMLVRLLAELGRLWRTSRPLSYEKHPGYTLAQTHGRLPTSSFGTVIFWDETQVMGPAEAEQVLRHELAHVRQGHTYDRLLLELLRAALWFNPFVHLCSRALALTHEYLADAAALRAEASPAASTSYSQLLARQVASRLGFSVPLAHSFSHSQTLRRIAMIQKTNSIRRWKQWLALPLLGLLLVAVACERNLDAVAPATTAIPSERIDNLAASSRVYTYVEKMPKMPGGGGNQAIVAFIQQHLAYPKVAAADQRTGRIFVSFVVDVQGNVQSPVIVKGLGAAYDEAVVAAVRQLPQLEPGTQDGKAVAVAFTVPVLFATATLPSGENVKIISH
jgi:TonB family protein